MRLETLEQICLFLNEGLYPYAPCEGTIGGLSYQPYIAVTYIGEGRTSVSLATSITAMARESQ